MQVDEARRYRFPGRIDCRLGLGAAEVTDSLDGVASDAYVGENAR